MIVAVHPSEAPTQEEALVSALRRPIEQGKGWGLLRTIALGAVSFGIAPMLAWPIRMRELFAGEAARFMQASKVITSQGVVWQYQRDLRRAAERTAPRPLLWIIPVVAATLLLLAGVQLFYLGYVRRADALVRMTYGGNPTFPIDDGVGQYVFALWTGALLVGYLVHLIHVQVHFSAVRRFLVQFNGVLEMRGMHAIALPRRMLAPNLLWLAAGAVMAGCFNAWWALPMMIGGAWQRRDAYRMHRDLRTALADRVAALADAPAAPELRCPTPQCRALLRPGARFCPRCGSAVNPLFNSPGLLA